MSLEAVVNFFINTKQAQNELNKINKRFDSVGKGFKRFMSFGIPGFTMVQAFKAVYHDLENIGNLSERFPGLPTEDIATFQKVLASFGGENTTAIATLQKLGNAIAQFRTTSSGPLLTVGSQIGLELRNADGSIKNSIQLLEELHERFKYINDDAKITVLSELGIDDPAVLRLLKSSDEAFRGAFRDSKADSDRIKEAVSTMDLMRKNWENTKSQLKDFGYYIMTGFKPAMEEVDTKLTKTTSILNDESLPAATRFFGNVLAGLKDIGDVIIDGMIMPFARWIGLTDAKNSQELLKRTLDPVFRPEETTEPTPEWSPFPEWTPMPEWTPIPSETNNSTDNRSVKNTFNFNIYGTNPSEQRAFLANLQRVIRNSTTGVAT